MLYVGLLYNNVHSHGDMKLYVFAYEGNTETSFPARNIKSSAVCEEKQIHAFQQRYYRN